MGTEVVSINKYDRPNWVTIIAFGLFHIGAVAALFFFTWKAFWVSVVLYWLTIGFGISLGYHRLHTHRGFKIAKPLEYLFALFGAARALPERAPVSAGATNRFATSVWNMSVNDSNAVAFSSQRIRSSVPTL